MLIKHILHSLTISQFLLLTSGTSQPLIDHPVAVEPRVVGGTASVTSGSYEYFVHIQVIPSEESPFICGGTLIHSDIVLTGAQCYVEGSTVTVRVGASNAVNGIRRNVEQILPHEGYRSGFENDIMVLKLSTPVLNRAVRYNTNQNVPLENQLLKVLGFGTDSETNPGPSDLLRTADVFGGNFVRCNQQYSSRLTAKMHICTNNNDRLQSVGGDSCNGDGGGPMILKRPNDASDLVVGIVSFGLGCGRSGAYSGYSSTAFFSGWIAEKVCMLSSNPPSTCQPTLCFSGDSLVHVLNKGKLKLSDAMIGDQVMVGPNMYESIHSFGHRNPSSMGKMLEIKTTKSTIQLSRDHMIFINKHHAIPASMLQIGDKLVHYSGEIISIIAIKTVLAAGAYAPFTPSGMIIVDDTLASVYVALQPSADLKICGVSFTFQWIAHSFEFPHRIFCYYLGTCHNETYTETGLSQWVANARKFSSWLLSQNTLVRNIILVAILVLCAVGEALENSSRVSLALLVIAMLSTLARRLTYQSRKNN